MFVKRNTEVQIKSISVLEEKLENSFVVNIETQVILWKHINVVSILEDILEVVDNRIHLDEKVGIYDVQEVHPVVVTMVYFLDDHVVLMSINV